MFTGLLRPTLTAGLAAVLLGLDPGPASAAGMENVCAPAANQVVVRFTYGSEKEAWIHEVTETFNRRGEGTSCAFRWLLPSRSMKHLSCPGMPR